jgi:hypothetical protein
MADSDWLISSADGGANAGTKVGRAWLPRLVRLANFLGSSWSPSEMLES